MAIAGVQPQQVVPLWLAEKAVIENAIEVCGGNIQRAAAALEISPSTIYRKKQSWPNQVSVSQDSSV